MICHREPLRCLLRKEVVNEHPDVRLNPAIVVAIERIILHQECRNWCYRYDMGRLLGLRRIVVCLRVKERSYACLVSVAWKFPDRYQAGTLTAALEQNHSSGHLRS
jgi:hypothetical protein